MRSTARTAVGAAALAVLLMALLASRGCTDAAPPAGTTHGEPATPAPAREAAANSAAPAPAPARAAATVAAPAPSAATLRVRLRGLHADAPWTAPLRLGLDGRDEPRNEWLDHDARAEPARGGACAFALPAWVLTATRQKGRLEADDPNYLPLEHRWAGALDLAAELVLDVQVVAVIEGRVVDARGEPVPAARLAAFAVRDGKPQDGKLGETNTAADGSYVLQAPPDTPLLLLAAPMEEARISGLRMTGRNGAIADVGTLRGDLLPASVRVAGAVGRPTRVDDLVLRDAAAVTGVVRWSDGRPVEGASVGTQPRGGSTFAMAPATAVRQLDDGSLSPVATAITGTDGAFALPAVPGASIDVFVVAVRDVVGAGTRQPAVAPQRLELSLPLPVRVRAVREGAPVGTAVTIEVEGQAPRASGPDGVLPVIVGAPVRVRASHERQRSPWATVGPVAAGTTVDLELAEVLTEVAIDFRGDFPVRNATLSWQRDDGQQGRQHVARDDRSGPFRLFLEPGVYRLRAEPGGGERNGLFLLPAERELTVARERLEVVLPAVFGGNFVVHATDRSGVYVGGTCRLRDAAGQDVSGPFLARSSIGLQETRPGDLMADGPNEFARMLAPGEYRLELDFPEHGMFERRVAIRARETTEVRIRLP